MKRKLILIVRIIVFQMGINSLSADNFFSMRHAFIINNYRENTRNNKKKKDFMNFWAKIYMVTIDPIYNNDFK